MEGRGGEGRGGKGRGGEACDRERPQWGLLTDYQQMNKMYLA